MGGAQAFTYDGQPICLSFPSQYTDPEGLINIQYNSIGSTMQKGRVDKPLHVLHISLPGGLTIQVNEWNEAGEGAYLNAKIYSSLGARRQSILQIGQTSMIVTHTNWRQQKAPARKQKAAGILQCSASSTIALQALVLRKKRSNRFFSASCTFLGWLPKSQGGNKDSFCVAPSSM